MDADANPSGESGATGGPGPSADDLAAMAGFAEALADGVAAAVGPWVVASVERVHLAVTGERAPAAVLDDARRVADEAEADVVPRVRALLATDVDEQRTNPLSIVRGAVRYPTAVLRRAGVAPVERDPMAVQQFPDDDYDLTPASFAELDPSLQDLGLTWGAAKAHVHLSRRRAEGRR